MISAPSSSLDVGSFECKTNAYSASHNSMFKTATDNSVSLIPTAKRELNARSVHLDAQTPQMDAHRSSTETLLLDDDVCSIAASNSFAKSSGNSNPSLTTLLAIANAFLRNSTSFDFAVADAIFKHASKFAFVSGSFFSAFSNAPNGKAKEAGTMTFAFSATFAEAANDCDFPPTTPTA